MRFQCTLAVALTLVLFAISTSFAQSRRGELRGIKLSADQIVDWEAFMATLEANGFNAAFIDFEDTAEKQLAPAAEAAVRHGIELHAARMCWKLTGVSPEVVKQFEETDRLQRDSTGRLARDWPSEASDWLCPSNPANREREKASIRKLLKQPKIAGVHLEYVQFPAPLFCFCENCKEQFQRDAAVQVGNWPEDVLEGDQTFEKWIRWRQEQLTSFVEEITDEVHASRPEAAVSIAAWPNLQDAARVYGQDWVSWAKEGAVDFVMPTNCTPDGATLSLFVESQSRAVRGAVPVYSSLCASGAGSAWGLIKQIQFAREAGADGFVVTASTWPKLVEWLPDLRSTVTAIDPNPSPHGHPPVRFTFSGEAAQPGDDRAFATGKVLDVAIVLGWEPPSPSEGETPGAAEAEAMLRRVLDPRAPIITYGDHPGIQHPVGQEERLSGRILVERPNGQSLRVCGVFDSAYRFDSKIRAITPEGRFRIAIYGSLGNAQGTRDFVVRTPLLFGVSEQEDKPIEGNPSYSDIEALRDSACGRPEVALLRRSLSPITIQLRTAGEQPDEWWMRLTPDSCETGHGDIDSPDLTVTLAAADLLALAHGEVGPHSLVETGRLSVTGDPALIKRLAELYSSR